MRANALKARWQQGETTLNAWLHIPSSWSAEVIANQGWDSAVIDLQHGLIDYSTALPMLQAISTTPTVPMVRVPWNEPGIIMKMLDAGAYGVICPMINTPAEAEAFVGACRYAPEGYRSLGPTRAALYGGADYAQHANREILALAMIETQQALDNLEGILSVKGLDGVYIGPGDLSLSLRGRGSMDNDDDEFLAILTRALAAVKARGLIAGIHTNSPDYAQKMRALGFHFMTIMTDTRMLATMSQQILSTMRDTLSERPKSIY